VCSEDDSKFCLIYSLENNLKNLEEVKDMANVYKKAPIRFFYVSSGFKE
jgi:hypothetical protein